MAVGEPDESLVKVDQEIETVESTARKGGHTPDTLTSFRGDSEGEREKVLDNLSRHGWIHFACHGILDTKDPFSSHFKIGGGKMSLMDIIRLNLPNTELAFLSACHSAEQPEYITSDESLHLAAAMQFCVSGALLEPCGR